MKRESKIVFWKAEIGHIKLKIEPNSKMLKEEFCQHVFESRLQAAILFLNQIPAVRKETSRLRIYLSQLSRCQNMEIFSFQNFNLL